MILPFKKKFNNLNSLSTYNDNNQVKHDSDEEFYDYYDNEATTGEEDVVYDLYGRWKLIVNQALHGSLHHVPMDIFEITYFHL